MPLACVATVGTTSTASIDPVPAIAEICRREGVWLHVDGAYGGVLAIAPEFRWVLDGVDGVDSFVVNPHKWLFTPFDCSVLYLKRADVLKRAFSLVPEFLVTREQEEVVNYMDYGVQLGRRFRALKLWMVIRAFGVEGLDRRVCARTARSRASSRNGLETSPDGKSSHRSTFHSSAFVSRRKASARSSWTRSTKRSCRPSMRAEKRICLTRG